MWSTVSKGGFRSRLGRLIPRRGETQGADFRPGGSRLLSEARPRAGAGCPVLAEGGHQLRGRRNWTGARPFSSEDGASTQLGLYLQRCGAVWGDAPEVHGVVAADSGLAFSWRVDLPPDRLKRLRRGEPLESPPFSVESMGRARFQFFPKGDVDCAVDDLCSLWLWTDSEDPVRFRLRAGSCEREGGNSEFCRLEDALRDGVVQVGLELEAVPSAGGTAETAEPQTKGRPSHPAVQQSLQLTGLQSAEWQIFNIEQLLRAGELLTSPPFRFHHVLLGDMYLELLPGVPHPEHCTLFFRCRVPTMKLGIDVSAGSANAFSKSFVALGRSTPAADREAGRCLGVNLDAPGVLCPDGSLLVRCSLQEVVLIPATLRDMIPKLDERAQWPKRL